MRLRTSLATAVGALGLAAAAFYAPAASADRVGFSVSVGGPGYALSVGNYGYGYGYYDYWRPAPVVVAPYAPYYRPYYPRPVVVAPPVVYRPYPVYRAYYGGHHRHDHRGWDRGRYDRHDRR